MYLVNMQFNISMLQIFVYETLEVPSQFHQGM